MAKVGSNLSDRGIVTRADLLTFYVLFRYLNLAKNRELSLRKDRKQGQGEETGSSKYDYSFPAADSHGHISVYCGELIELMNQTNLVARELLTTRECMNFLVRLLNNSILQPESLLKRAAEYFSQLAAIFEEGFASKVAQDIRVGLTRNGGNIDSAGFLKSKLGLTAGEVQYLELFARADLWQTMGALRDGLWFRDLTAKSEDAIADSLMNSYISFRKSVNVLVNGDQQGSPAQGFKIGPNFKW